MWYILNLAEISDTFEMYLDTVTYTFDFQQKVSRYSYIYINNLYLDTQVTYTWCIGPRFDNGIAPGPNSWSVSKRGMDTTHTHHTYTYNIAYTHENYS